jgi:hypothetical protein
MNFKVLTPTPKSKGKERRYGIMALALYGKCEWDHVTFTNPREISLVERERDEEKVFRGSRTKSAEKSENPDMGLI